VGFEIDPAGLDKLRRKLGRDLPQAGQKKAREVLRKASTDLRDEVRNAAPMDTGTLRRSIYAKLLPSRFGAPESADVRVQTGLRAARKNRDGFYWRFIEYGTKFQRARPFIAPTLERFRGRFAAYFDEYKKALGDEFDK
jgi:HK97 gp10 family phage protein